MCSCVQDVPMKWFLTIYCNMAIYCNTLEDNIQYGDYPYYFTPSLCLWLCICMYLCVCMHAYAYM